MSSFLHLLPPISLPTSPTWSVFVSSVSSPNTVTLLLLGENYWSKLSQLGEDMEIHYGKMTNSSSKLMVGQMYAARVGEDWHRVKLEQVEEEVCFCLLIDQGEKERINSFFLSDLEEKFLDLPAQVVTVDLAGLEDVKLGQFETELVRRNLLHRSMVAKVVNWKSIPSENTIRPLVTLFDTSSEVDVDMNKAMLFLVNSKEMENKDKKEKIIAVSDKFKGASVNYYEVSNTTLTIGDLMDITVCLAISPSYFVIQSNCSAGQLEQLSYDMNSFYEEQQGQAMLEMKYVDKGIVVAVRHEEEGDWYRARVKEILDEDNMIVRLLDFGDLELAVMENVRMLDEQFCMLASQAVNARIAGVMPAGGDWGRGDEEWWERRVAGAMFVCQVGEEWEVGGDYGVELVMYDTSQENDILIQEEMVELGRAIYIETF